MKIHLAVRGPGIAPGATFSYPASNVDFSPTFLGLAGLPTPATMDGRSLVPLLIKTTPPLPPPRSPTTGGEGGKGADAGCGRSRPEGSGDAEGDGGAGG